MKNVYILLTLSACGMWTANANNYAADSATISENVVETENSSGENAPDTQTSRESHIYNQPALADAVGSEASSSTPQPIPAIILPNNICVINTDLSPDRTIEEHIIACVRAQKIRQSIRR